MRDLALFNMAVDNKQRGCEVVKLKVSDVAYCSSVSSRVTVLQQKTGSPTQFELTKGTRESVTALIKLDISHSKYFFLQGGANQHVLIQQHNRIFHGWVPTLDLEDLLYSACLK